MTYQREDEEEAMAEGNESVSRSNPIKLICLLYRHQFFIVKYTNCKIH